LQAAIGGKFIARENIGAYRKDVTGYLYGGDVSRKKKLLAKQAKGKKRMKRFGKVDIPSEAFMKKVEKAEGRDLNYTVMTYDDFYYRLSVRDKFVSEIVNGACSVLVDTERVLSD
jgi:hypothetical protein